MGANMTSPDSPRIHADANLESAAFHHQHCDRNQEFSAPHGPHLLSAARNDNRQQLATAQSPSAEDHPVEEAATPSEGLQGPCSEEASAGHAVSSSQLCQTTAEGADNAVDTDGIARQQQQQHDDEDLQLPAGLYDLDDSGLHATMASRQAEQFPTGLRHGPHEVDSWTDDSDPADDTVDDNRRQQNVVRVPFSPVMNDEEAPTHKPPTVQKRLALPLPRQLRIAVEASGRAAPPLKRRRLPRPLPRHQSISSLSAAASSTHEPPSAYPLPTAVADTAAVSSPARSLPADRLARSSADSLGATSSSLLRLAKLADLTALQEKVTSTSQSAGSADVSNASAATVCQTATVRPSAMPMNQSLEAAGHLQQEVPGLGAAATEAAGVASEHTEEAKLRRWEKAIFGEDDSDTERDDTECDEQDSKSVPIDDQKQTASAAGSTCTRSVVPFSIKRRVMKFPNIRYRFIPLALDSQEAAVQGDTHETPAPSTVRSTQSSDSEVHSPRAQEESLAPAGSPATLHSKRANDTMHCPRPSPNPARDAPQPESSQQPSAAVKPAHHQQEPAANPKAPIAVAATPCQQEAAAPPHSPAVVAAAPSQQNAPADAESSSAVACQQPSAAKALAAPSSPPQREDANVQGIAVPFAQEIQELIDALAKLPDVANTQSQPQLKRKADALDEAEMHADGGLTDLDKLLHSDSYLQRRLLHGPEEHEDSVPQAVPPAPWRQGQPSSSHANCDEEDAPEHNEQKDKPWRRLRTKALKRDLENAESRIRELEPSFEKAQKCIHELVVRIQDQEQWYQGAWQKVAEKMQQMAHEAQAQITFWREAPLGEVELHERPYLRATVQNAFHECVPEHHRGSHACNRMRSARVTQVRQVANIRLWTQYKARRAEMVDLLKKEPTCPWAHDVLPGAAKLHELLPHIPLVHDANEVLVFHGTTKAKAQDIVHGIEGFDERCSKRELYGRAVYFSTEVCKAAQDEYLRGDGCIIIARLILGHPYQAMAGMHGNARPPKIQGGNRVHDSTVARPGIPKGKGWGKTSATQVHYEVNLSRCEAMVYPELLVDFHIDENA
eukprot:TRINITY_DN32895_c0_g1_i2.p1 TRINITY_DN32895_c0_g1~~TRINITY_DN32895_c0_g1_i2.p1  ORF type:complete len:1067 (-),score=134.80 TRINITY_DN32895_c0_g1_i2:260-3460(-)